MALEVLVVDDEADIRELVSGVLEDEGFTVRSAADSTAALEAIEERRPSLVLLDVWLQGSRLDGLQILQEVKRRDPNLPVLMISGHGNLDTAVAAIREGAIDFIEKPFEAERLLHLVNRATETDRLRRENETLRAQTGHDDQLHGTSVAINNVRATLKRVAPTGSRVLITGPAGVGKEIAARMIHQWSPRAKAPFIVVSAAMMSPDRVEEELFGSEVDGVARPGLLEQAHEMHAIKAVQRAAFARPFLLSAKWRMLPATPRLGAASSDGTRHRSDHVRTAVDQQLLVTGFDQDGCSSAPVARLGGVARAPIIPDPRYSSRGPAAQNAQLHAEARENNRKKFAVVVSARVSGSSSRSSATNLAVSATKAGSQVWPRCGTGARKGESVSTSIRSGGSIRAVS